MRACLTILAVLAINLLIPTCHAQDETAVPITIVIHGGAGTIEKAKFTPQQEQAYRATLKQAVEAGYAVLKIGGKSLDAVTTAINVLESSPYFNAGVGAVYTAEETHELDASIMDGSNRQAGAVAGVKHVEHPIDLAKLVMERSPHVMLSGEGAEAFAKASGVTMVDNAMFNTEHRYEALLKTKKKLRDAMEKTPDYQAAHDLLDPKFKMGTVGAVALDSLGNLAAGTSTGGMTNKQFGRVGDSPIIGAGTFADNASCAVSATGHGEYFIRYAVASDICARVAYQDKTIKQAGYEVIHQVLPEAGGTGGVIILDTQGNISMPFNTAGMYRAYKNSPENTYVAIFKDE
ncbi:isoaspartyl peptidase/L-asparaginase [Corallincola holothuriorum]|uniref:Isoaspartyl peptidase n=1 Tax=Corallincola holothuriorum TaxID=2282215 RepID=A0A368NGJ5_9GAMM|nr:isoaspartyl peptidase/L-asparaginase [Corallincola holothuriorum]RCU49250.1 isoaspartyl peptidase/L-asparaginase [Corallincola holothuriorum]